MSPFGIVIIMLLRTKTQLGKRISNYIDSLLLVQLLVYAIYGKFNTGVEV